MARSPRSTEPAAPEQPSFEESLHELESVVQQLESSELPLEQALALFEKGVQLSDTCRKQLQDAETRVETLLKKRAGETPAAPASADPEDVPF